MIESIIEYVNTCYRFVYCIIYIIIISFYLVDMLLFLQNLFNINW